MCIIDRREGNGQGVAGEGAAFLSPIRLCPVYGRPAAIVKGIVIRRQGEGDREIELPRIVAAVAGDLLADGQAAALYVCDVDVYKRQTRC